jgi:hypothetical protein
MNVTPECLAAVEECLRLVEILGENHPDTLRATMLALELAPEEIKAKVSAMARKLDLMPDACGYLADGTPMFSLGDVAEKLGMPPEEAEASLQAFLAERESLGLSNAGITFDPALINSKQ